MIAAQGHTAAVDWWTLGILIYEMIVSQRYSSRPSRVWEIADGQLIFNHRDLLTVCHDTIQGQGEERYICEYPVASCAFS